MREDLTYLSHIIKSINKIKLYIKDIKDEKCDAVVRRIEIIGEAASKISSSLKLKINKFRGEI